MLEDVREYKLEMFENEHGVFLFSLVAHPGLMVRVIEGQTVDHLCQSLRDRILSGKLVEG